MKKFLAGLAVVLMGYGLPGMASALPISVVNGGFESGLSGWTPSGSVSADIAIPPGATEGSYYAKLTDTSFIMQGVSWDAGDKLSFDWIFTPEATFSDLSLFFNIDTEVFSSSTMVSLSPGEIWSTYEHLFTSAGSGWISFASLGSGSLYLDNVTAKPVPEPATMLLFGSGLAGLVGMARRRMGMAA